MRKYLRRKAHKNMELAGITRINRKFAQLWRDYI